MTFLDRVKWAFTNQGGYWAAAVGLIGAGVQAYGMFSAPGGKVPTAVRAQMAAQQAQQDAALRMQQMLQPFILDQMGLEAVIGPDGNMSGLRKRPLTASEQQDADIKDLANQKVLKGLRGELDIDPAATRSLDEQDANQKAMLKRTLGPDYALSTAGSTAISREAESRNVTEASIRTGEMTSAESIAQDKISNSLNQQKISLGLAGGMPGSMMDMSNNMAFPSVELANAAFARQTGQATGWAQLGSGLLSGAGGLMGAYLASQRRPPTPVYSPSVFSGGGAPLPQDQTAGP